MFDILDAILSVLMFLAAIGLLELVFGGIFLLYWVFCCVSVGVV